ncbi:uncharacterized protein LOC100571648 [Acyrthosiphon pisum]|uniref:Uncharacterized protein n=1 Tax=Acyrthosiphon pisum TaxID=7029 RepID=A0A8R2HA46_ACYPI|nr:uncharacterized protein LOC100571648 [Acyrthosiphon pisum]XP_016661222.1 uncharacterized protein LOC100571648 [Acyrthosiphon pisum]|eukprot:XP_003245597.1 PREDICTED: uncharacterized protein LOC100571648 [Acyrthosiphon pisum]
MSADKETVLRPHKNSSRRQTFEMPGGESERARQSTTHETYRPPKTVAEKPLDDKERKRKEFEEYLWKTMTEKVMNDLAAKSKTFYDQNRQFETTYSSTFKIKGFKPKEIGEQLDEELCAKYPLYNTNGMSVPVNRYEYVKAKQSIHKPLAHLFKKDSRFTSRMSNPNDYHAPVDPEHFAFV